MANFGSLIKQQTPAALEEGKAFLKGVNLRVCPINQILR